ncbi:Alpha/Beta hydrolase protein [Achaetomium macrosporum]|uniref:Carboxylic ester hydrolase n=1 Tax=Achaetomium macrosporum TaxID=79813 RepID=A0AAN7C393_9PEZI|nr:Alpha/Beta hydrolase protein [Achaetomium macrosporum]
MWFLWLLISFPLFLPSLADPVNTTTAARLTVKTITGVYTGLVDPEFPDVRQFRSIPYAEPPLGKRRWLPPVPVTPSLRHSYAYRFPSPCPQYMSKNLTVWNSNITNFSIRLHGQSRTAGAMAQTSSEDCLYLAIWTPLNATADSNLPVALFIPGGSFVSGGIDVPYQQPTPWVQRTQRHIFVAANYRVNIVGFPWAAGLDEQNVGILDQRAALEWVYANIGSFGGDPSRITLWGHSAGGVAADMLAHAYHDNPLAAGLFLQSGTAMVNISWPDPTHSNFTFVARNLGCDFPSDPQAELACMRQVPMSLIQNFIGQYRDNGTTTPSLPPFKPIPDERTVFFNYTLRALQNLTPQIPALVSTTANEQSSLTRYPLSNITLGPYQPSVDDETVSVFVCLASNTTRSRTAQRLTTYRYEYAGNFSSVTPLGWMGAYHASDVPMVFGTYETLGERDSVSAYQREVARVMQDYVLAFMEDAEAGLRGRGWPAWEDTTKESGSGREGRNMMRFAGRKGLVQEVVSADEVDDACILGKGYNSSP